MGIGEYIVCEGVGSIEKVGVYVGLKHLIVVV